MGRLFGTDGVRGVANRDLTPELALAIGKAAATVLTNAQGHRPTVVIGKDTRASSDMLEAALTAGLCAVGADVIPLGVVPTPAVAYLAGHYRAQAGVMISASHNPCEYNGIKLFYGDGYKLPDATEDEIEALIQTGMDATVCPVGGAVGRLRPAPDAVSDYVSHLTAAAECRLDGMKIAVDCANGAAAPTAARLFKALGAQAVMLHNTPDGENINRDCGSTDMASLSAYVVEHGLFAGVAFDGDADRCLMVDERGDYIDGDQMMAALAVAMKRRGTLKQDTVVATVMSNLGFMRFCEAQGITPLATAVGDRYVLEKMREGGYTLGGEQSGHIIFLDDATTGDGQLSALRVLCACREAGQPLSRFIGGMQRYPQLLVNVTATAAQKTQYRENEALRHFIEEENAKLEENGRLLVRVSGTEPLIRIMAEGLNEQEIHRAVADVEHRITEEIGKHENGG